MELTLEVGLHYYNYLLQITNKIESTFIELGMLNCLINTNKDIEQEFINIKENIKNHIEKIKNIIKDKYYLKKILDKNIENITLENILEL